MAADVTQRSEVHRPGVPRPGAPPPPAPAGPPRPSLAERLEAWAEHAMVEHEAALAAAAAYAARTGSGPAAAALELQRLGLVEAMREVERAARRVYGDPPAEWARYYPSPAGPVQGPHATEIVLAAGSINRSLEVPATRLPAP
jgi:hypothetical protein